VTVCFTTIHNDEDFENGKPKKTIKILKIRNYKYGIHLKKLDSQSEMRASPIYDLRQSSVRLNKLLN
jgi:hypothetical protein